MSENEKKEAPQAQKWTTIVSDMFILCIIMGAICGLCKLAQIVFERPSPHDNIMSVVRKNEIAAKEKVDENQANITIIKEIARSSSKETVNVDGAEVTTEISKVNVMEGNKETVTETTTLTTLKDGKETVTEDVKVYTQKTKKRNVELVNDKFIVELKASIKKDKNFVNSRDGNEMTPLMRVSFANYNDAHLDAKADLERLYYLRQFLAQEGIKVEAKDKHGFNALHWAAWSGMGRVAVVLMEHGLNINEPDSNGFTPLMLSALRGNVQTTEVLLSLGADASLKNKDGKTALDLAQSHEESYGQRKGWVYKLIYAETRDEGHTACVKMFKNIPEQKSIEHFAKLVQIDEELYLDELNKIDEDSAQAKVKKEDDSEELTDEEKKAKKKEAMKRYTDWIANGEKVLAETSADESSADESSADETSADETSADESSADEATQEVADDEETL